MERKVRNVQSLDRRKRRLYSLSLKLVRSNNVGNRNHLVLVDRIKILRNVLWAQRTHRLESHEEWNHAHRNEQALLIHPFPLIFIFILQIMSANRRQMMLIPEIARRNNAIYTRHACRVSHCVYVVLSDHNNPSVAEKQPPPPTPTRTVTL